MKASLLSLGLLGGTALAFPRGMDFMTEALQANALAQLEERDIAARQAVRGTEQGTRGRGLTAPLPLAPPPFDRNAQLVSTSGANSFIAPGPNDARGPCPGLNALSNHGYLPRNGRATIDQFREATRKVFGMAPDLGGFLANFGALVDGDGSSWSIAGNIREGIGGSHNNYETDSSPCRADLNQYGSNSRLIVSQFRNLYDRQPATGFQNYNLEVLRDFRKSRYDESVAKNPWFFYGPFPGIEVSQAAFTFIYRFMSNKSAEYPSGILDRNVIKSFMSITEDSNGGLTWVPGHERIPDNWYKRNPSDEYSVQYFETDILYFAQTVPEVLQVGCNTGRVNSFNKITPETLTNGAYTAAQVARSPICFASEFTKASLPGITGLPLTSPLLSPLVSTLNAVTGPLNCAAIGSVNQSAVAACPGFSFYGGIRGPVAPGAIQTP